MDPRALRRPRRPGYHDPRRRKRRASGAAIMPDSQTTEASATGSLPAGLEERTVPPPDAKEPLNLAISAGTSQPGTVTARKAGGLRDLGLEVNPRKIGLAGALQHLAKSVNIAFQADFGENSLESVYQAAIVQRGAVRI